MSQDKSNLESPTQPGPGEDASLAAARQTLRAKLNCPPSEPLDLPRVHELLAMLTERLMSLDQLTWNTWRSIAPNSPRRRNLALLKALSRFLRPDPQLAPEQLAQDLDATSQLIAAIIVAIGQAARQFAHNHATRFSPSEIESLATMEKSWNPFISHEVKCWRKYKELAAGQDETALEAEIRQTIADLVESLLKGTGR